MLIFNRRGKLGRLRQNLREAKTYEEWKEAALVLDTHMGKDVWRNQPKMAYYDHKLISNLLEKTAKYRKSGQVEKLMEILLQAGLRSNVGNIDSVRLYSNTYYGTKKVSTLACFDLRLPGGREVSVGR